jgi:hypothetical protein
MLYENHFFFNCPPQFGTREKIYLFKWNKLIGNLNKIAIMLSSERLVQWFLLSCLKTIVTVPWYKWPIDMFDVTS